MTKLAVVILDGLDPGNMRRFKMENIQELYQEENSNILGCSSHPHTVMSNLLIWGGETRKVYWARNKEGWGEPENFSDFHGEKEDLDLDLLERSDLDIAFIWDVLDYHGLDVSAVQIPFVLPPYSFNAVEELEDSWFPSEQDKMMEHVEKKPEIIARHAEAGKDFIASSIAMPDKWLHQLESEGERFRPVIEEQAPVFDEKIREMIEVFESEGYDWVIFGDHGSPVDGNSPVFRNGGVGRHDKESIIISNLDEIPSYTSELYEFFLDYFGVGEVGVDELEIEVEGRVGDEKNIVQRLRELGYI